MGDSMFEDFLGPFQWPLAVILVVLILVVGGNTYADNRDDAEVRGQIIRTCAGAENPATCAKLVRQAVGG